MNQSTDNQLTHPLTDKTILEVTEKILPEINEQIKDKTSITDSDHQEINTYINEIDMSDTNTILFFGTKAQQQLTSVSDTMLEGVSNKDAGPAANSLNEMVATLRGFGADKLAENPSIFSRFFKGLKPIATFLQQYEEISEQIDKVTDNLESHKTTLLTDIASLDRLYDASLEYFGTLENYILNVVQF